MCTCAERGSHKWTGRASELNCPSLDAAQFVTTVWHLSIVLAVVLIEDQPVSFAGQRVTDCLELNGWWLSVACIF
jgi:hypothetical protein